MDTAGKMSISIRCAIGESGLKNLVSSFQTRNQKDPFSLNRFPPPPPSSRAPVIFGVMYVVGMTVDMPNESGFRRAP